MTLRAVLWDNDGVLVNTERLFYDVNHEICAEHGFDLSKADFFEWFLLSNCGAWHVFRARGYSEQWIREVRHERNRRFSDALSARRELAMDGIEIVLRTLAPIVAMALVTSSSREVLALAHKNTDLLRYFAVVVAEEDCAFSKPSPEPYLLALQKLNVAPEQCIAVEDSPRGVLAAKAAGIKCIAVSSELTSHYRFDEAYAVVKGTSDLLDVFRCLL